MVLEADDQLVGGDVAGAQDYEGLDYVAAYGVRAGDDRGLCDGGVLDESALDLEGADPVPGGDYHVVGPADEIVVSVLVLVSLVARVVPVTLEDASGGLLVAPILTEQPDGSLRFDAHGYLALTLQSEARHPLR